MSAASWRATSSAVATCDSAGSLASPWCSCRHWFQLTHQRLAQIEQTEASAEIVRSKDCLQQVLGEPVPHFCYPYGSYDNAVVDMVAQAGYRSAVSCDGARAYPGTNALRLPRKAISFGDSLVGYAWKLHMKAQPHPRRS